ncbi:MAG: hypothetical protein ACJAVJ_000869 [Planctomycetota bacterium]|jgi:hypothetical protein
MNDSNDLDQAPLPLAPPAPTRSKGMKTLLSCGCGCAVLLLVLAIAAVFGFRYYFGPGDQIPTDHMLGDDTVYIMHMDALSQDVGAKELVVELIQVIMKMNPESLAPEEREDFEKMLSTMKDLSIEDVEQVIDYLPSSMTFIAEDNGTELTKSFGVNLSAGSRALKWMVSTEAEDSGWNTHEHSGYEIFEATSGKTATGADPDIGFIGFQHDTFFFSNDKDSLQRILVRTSYEDEPGPPAESELRADLDQLRERWLLSGVLRDSPRLNLPAVFADALGSDASPLTADDLQWLDSPFAHATTGLGFVGTDMTLRVEVTGLAEADVAEVAAGFEQLGAHLTQSLAAEELEFLFEVIQGTTSLAINANVLALQVWLENQVLSGETRTENNGEAPVPEMPIGEPAVEPAEGL